MYTLHTVHTLHYILVYLQVKKYFNKFCQRTGKHTNSSWRFTYQTIYIENNDDNDSFAHNQNADYKIAIS